jgi:UDP-4-amino-4,6-dideoxy-N-acetyl-beta-L-altrosamine N-acetyltransferase
MAAAVTLRPLQPDDSERLYAWRNSPEVAAYMYTDHQIGPDEHARWFAAAATDPRRAYWVIEVDAAPVGLANVYDIDRHHGRAAWAYYLADPAVRGKGVGGYVEYWMIQRAFGPPETQGLGLRKLWCEVLASNEAVWKMHLKFGFREEARLRAHVIKNGAPQDVLGLGLLATDWDATRPAMAQRLERMGFALPDA